MTKRDETLEAHYPAAIRRLAEIIRQQCDEIDHLTAATEVELAKDLVASATEEDAKVIHYPLGQPTATSVKDRQAAIKEVEQSLVDMGAVAAEVELKPTPDCFAADIEAQAKAEEREACAQVAENWGKQRIDNVSSVASVHIAAAIRARKP
jgi:hypothetical protein